MRWVAYAVGVVVFGFVAQPAAFAHDDVVGTSPSNGDRITQVPEEVRIEFAERPSSGSGSITGPTGQAVRGGEARVDGAALVIPMRPAIELGIYVVEFRVTSTDGHSTAGSLTFELIQPTPVTTTSAPEKAPTDAAVGSGSPAADDAGAPAWLWVFLASGVGVAVVVLLIARAVFRARSAQ